MTELAYLSDSWAAYDTVAVGYAGLLRPGLESGPPDRALLAARRVRARRHRGMCLIGPSLAMPPEASASGVAASAPTPQPPAPGIGRVAAEWALTESDRIIVARIAGMSSRRRGTAAQRSVLRRRADLLAEHAGVIGATEGRPQQLRA
ncbi:MAG TPA: hypothetical protein VMU94_00020 [Streptosporangiaceae bacterium]|nr:hypothetical protein [Streptosporangiaceae bacterium]